MSVRLGWYVHHHGRGHLVRMLAIARELDAEILCFSSLDEPDDLPARCTWIALGRDDDVDAESGDPREGRPTAEGLLHWAPVGHAGHRRRMATIVRVLDSRPVDAFVVDVSVEVALLVRLLGVRPILVAQPGHRTDPPHQLGYTAAEAIIAPWPESLVDAPGLDPFRAKTVFTGGISRFDGRPRPVDAGGAEVALLGGRGGKDVSDEDIDRAAASSGHPWHVIGARTDAWTTDPWESIAAASVVVSWAGQNGIADLAAADARAVVIAQERPFAEQRSTAAALQRAGLAVVADEWPAPERWPELLEAARALTPDWSRWRVPGAARRAADAITAVARRRR